MPRCDSVSDQGLQCGLDAGHDGNHYAITPSCAKWPTEPSTEPVKDHQLVDGTPCTLERLCREEPAWASSIIRHYRQLFDELVESGQVLGDLLERCEKGAMRPPREGGWKHA